MHRVHAMLCHAVLWQCYWQYVVCLYYCWHHRPSAAVDAPCWNRSDQRVLCCVMLCCAVLQAEAGCVHQSGPLPCPEWSAAADDVQECAGMVRWSLAKWWCSIARSICGQCAMNLAGNTCDDDDGGVPPACA